MKVKSLSRAQLLATPWRRVTLKIYVRIQNPFMLKIKIQQTFRNKRQLPQADKELEIPQLTSYLMVNVECFPPKIRNKTKMLLQPCLFNIVLEVLPKAMRQEKEIKGIQTGN